MTPFLPVRFLLTASLAVLSLTAVLAQAPRKSAPKPAAKPASRPPAQPAPAVVPSIIEAVLPTTFTAGPFEVGTSAVNLGVGVGSRYGYGNSALGGRSSVSPAVSVSFERGLLAVGPGVIGVGLIAGYQGATYDLGSGNKWKYNDVIVMVRGAFHYPVTPELDAYGGVGIGWRHAGVSYEGSAYNDAVDNVNELAPGLFVGARYYLFENIGAFAELGYDQSYLKIGLAAKF